MLLTWLLTACATSRAASAEEERVFVSNEDSGDVSVLNAKTGAAIATIPVGKRPRGLRVEPSGKQLYVALSGSTKGGPNVDESQLPPPDRSADGIGVIDLKANRLERVLPSGADPETFDIFRGKLLVSNEDAARASVVDAASGKILTSLDAGGEPEGVTVSPDGRFGYVTSEADHRVTVIDLGALQVAARVAVGKRPRAVAFTPDGARALVTNELDGTVSVLDARQHRLVTTIALDSAASGKVRPMGIVVARDGKHAYVTTGRGGGVVELTVEPPAVTRTLAGVGPRCWGIDISADGARLWVANGPSNDVALIDVSAWRVTKRVPVGKGPWGVALAALGR